jgi:hypothetical protein
MVNFGMMIKSNGIAIIQELRNDLKVPLCDNRKSRPLWAHKNLAGVCYTDGITPQTRKFHECHYWPQ